MSCSRRKRKKVRVNERIFRGDSVRFAFALFVPLCGYGIFENALAHVLRQPLAGHDARGQRDSVPHLSANLEPVVLTFDFLDRLKVAVVAHVVLRDRLGPLGVVLEHRIASHSEEGKQVRRDQAEELVGRVSCHFG